MYPASEWLTEMRKIWGRTGQMIGIGAYSAGESNGASGEAADWQSDACHHAAKRRIPSVPANRACCRKPGCRHRQRRPEKRDLEDHLSKSFAWTLKFGGCGSDALELEYEHGQLAV